MREKSLILGGKIPLNSVDISTYIDKLAHDVVECLVGQKLKISCAESCTGGLLSSFITNVPGASDVTECSIVSYSERIKSQLLGLPMELIKDCGVVSDTVALAMAQGIRLVSGSDIGVGITGIAGPGGGTNETPVGTIYVSVVYKSNALTENLKLYELGTLSREVNRLAACAYALEAVIEAVKG